MHPPRVRPHHEMKIFDWKINKRLNKEVMRHAMGICKDYIAQMAAPQMKVCRESEGPWMEWATMEANIKDGGICKCCSIACHM